MQKAIADDCLTHSGQQPITPHKVGVLSRSQLRLPVVGLLPQPEHRVATRMRKRVPMKTVAKPVSTAHALADAVITAMLRADSDWSSARSRSWLSSSSASNATARRRSMPPSHRCARIWESLGDRDCTKGPGRAAPRRT